MDVPARIGLGSPLDVTSPSCPLAFDSLAQLIQRDPVTLYSPAPPKFAAGWETVRAVELHQGATIDVVFDRAVAVE